MFLRNSIVYISLIFLVSLLHSQNVVQSVKGKFGVQKDGNWLVSPRFDSIYASSSNYFTAYKKARIFYYTPQGDRIFKTKKSKKSFGTRFNNGYAFIRKKEFWGAIDEKGDNVVPYIYNVQPNLVGYLAVFTNETQYYKKVDLYGPNYKRLASNYDSIKALNNLLLAFGSKIETKRVKRKIIGTKKVSVNNLWTSIYDIKTGVLINKYKGHSYKQFGAMLQVVNYQNQKTLIDSLGNVLVESFSKIKQRANGDYLIYSANSAQTNFKAHVYLLYKHGKPLINNNGYHKITFKDSSIYAYYDVNRADIYSSSYKLLTPNVKIKNYQINNYHIFENDSGFYLGNETGVRKTNYYSNIDNSSENMMLIQKDSSFGYLNLTTLVETNFHPILTGISYTYGRTGKGLMKIFGTSYRTETWEVLFDGRNYNNGYAIIALNALDKDYQKGRSLDIGDETKLRYNYINKEGQLLTKDKYKAVYPFKNGKAWVRKTNYFYMIDTNGKADYSIKAEKINEIDSDHFVFKKGGDWGVIDHNYKIVVKPTYFHKPYVVKGKIILKDSGNKPDEFYQLPIEK